ncbi:MAG: hypothetical protein AB1758_10815 [Candidatus Eremiobacterota bacterium]
MRTTGSVRRGVAILTAMFVVVMLFSLIIAITAQTNSNTLFLRRGHQESQAYFSAKAGVNLALKSLNDDPTWETAHGSRDTAQRMESPPATMDVWVEPSAQPNLVYLHCVARVDGLQDHVTAAILKGSDIRGTVYAEVNRDGIDSLLYTTLNSPTWTPVPPAPNQFYRHDAATDTIQLVQAGGFASNLGYVCPDDQGNLYVVMRRDGSDAVFKFDPDTTTWSALPPVISQYWNGAGQLIVRPDKVAGDLRDLTSNGSDRLMVRLNRDNIDTIYSFDLGAWAADPNTAWIPLQPAPKRYYNDSGTLINADGFSPNLRHMSMDREGNLYAVQGFDSRPDTIYQYALETASWNVLPPPPRVLIRSSDGEIRVSTDAYPGNFRSGVAAGPDGEVYAGYDPDNRATTIYKFSPSGPAKVGVVPGQWTWLSPPPRRYHSGTAIVDQGGFAGNLRYLSVDVDGNLYAQWARGGRDEVFGYSSRRAYWELLDPIPKLYYLNDGTLAGNGQPWGVNILTLGVGTPDTTLGGGAGLYRWTSIY